jgi:hypothetical protein
LPRNSKVVILKGSFLYSFVLFIGMDAKQQA